MKKLTIAFISVALCCGCSCGQESMVELSDRVFSLAGSQSIKLASSLDENTTPRYFKDSLETAPVAWWCSGFFAGTLWQIYEYTRDSEIRDIAEIQTLKVEPMKYVTNDHDVGFQINCSFGNQYRLTGDENAKDVMVVAAKSLATSFNPAVGCIRSWAFQNQFNRGIPWQFPVIIDNLMNLELLMEAGHLSDDNSLIAVAESHAQTTMKNHYREDFSTVHLVDYNPDSGEIVRKMTVQGFSDDSAWARGQAWSLYGMVMMYRESGNAIYLNRAVNIADYLLARLPQDGIPFWDFDSPKIPEELKDASAAAVMASAFVDLSQYAADGDKYLALAEKQLRTLASEEYLVAPGEKGGFILKHSVGNYPAETEVDVSISYADYYFLEALNKYKKTTYGKKN